MNKLTLNIVLSLLISISLVGCSTPQKREFKLHNAATYRVWPDFGSLSADSERAKQQAKAPKAEVPEKVKRALPKLRITNLLPAALVTSRDKQRLTIHGENFKLGSRVHLCWPQKCVTLSGARVHFESSQELTINIATGMREEEWTLTVINPQQERSNTHSFKVVKLLAAIKQTVIEIPPEPEVSRYRFVGELHGESNYGIEREDQTFFEKLVGLMSGNRKPITLRRPQSGYTDPVGRTYVTDVSSQSIMVFDPVKSAPIQWEYVDEDNRFISPVAITPGPNNEFLVTDADLATIVRLDSNGKPKGMIAKGELKRPTGIAYDADSNLIYVADTGAHNIKVFDGTNHRLTQVIGGRGEVAGRFNYPTHIHFSDSRLYVTDTMNARVQVFDNKGKPVSSFGKRGLNVGDTPRPKGVTTDGDGNIYVIESYFDHLLVYNKKGQLLLPIGGTGKGVGEFYLPAGVWSDQQDRIYIADMFNGRIVVLQYLGGE